MKKIYLAGAITGKSFEGAVDWRESVKQKLAEVGLSGFSPMRGKNYLLGTTSISAGQYGKVLSTQKGIVTRDRNDVMTCDALIVNLLDVQRISIGTMIELGWADAFRKPIILVMDEGNLHDHAMVRELAGFIVDNVDDAVLVAAALLNLETAPVDVDAKID